MNDQAKDIEIKELTIVRRNLMSIQGYTGYCGDELCLPRTDSSPERWPRTKWIPELSQFVCPKCGWVSEYPEDFIKRYIAKWKSNAN